MSCCDSVGDEFGACNRVVWDHVSISRTTEGDVPDIYSPRECITASGSRARSEEHTSELQSLMRISYAVFCLKKKKTERKNRLSKTKQTEHIERTTTNIHYQ